ncbi:MAG: cysteine synthase A [Chitinophagaceae bacterium]
MNLKKNLNELVGKTPLVEIRNYAKYLNTKSNIFVKLESFNPCGSVKERIALAMVEDALEKGILKEKGTIIEPTSGNTGIGLSMVGAAKNLRVMLTMPETMSIERKSLMSLLGAELFLTPGNLGMKGAIEKANQLKEEIIGSVVLGQFENNANPLIHYHTTGVEIWEDTNGKTDIFIAGVGTGGTISGVGKKLKENNPNIQVVAVEPVESPVLSGGIHSPHKIQGIGAGFVPKNFHKDVVDTIMQVNTEESINTTKLLAKQEGILSGISSGAALTIATKLAQMKNNAGKNIVVILPDTGERYLSML